MVAQNRTLRFRKAFLVFRVTESTLLALPLVLAFSFLLRLAAKEDGFVLLLLLAGMFSPFRSSNKPPSVVLMSFRELGTDFLLRSRDLRRRGAGRLTARFMAGSSLHTELVVLSILRVEELA